MSPTVSQPFVPPFHSGYRSKVLPWRARGDKGEVCRRAVRFPTYLRINGCLRVGLPPLRYFPTTPRSPKPVDPKELGGVLHSRDCESTPVIPLKQYLGHLEFTDSPGLRDDMMYSAFPNLEDLESKPLPRCQLQTYQRNTAYPPFQAHRP